MKRSKFLQQLLAATAVPVFGQPAIAFANAKAQSTDTPGLLSRGLKTSLNAYSFNDPLMKGSLKPEELLQFCAEQGFDAIDMTGYYFKGYPVIPTDETIFSFKRKALAHGIAISGTGVRNDFTNEDPKLRLLHVDTVKAWIEVAAKLGAPVLRIFTGLQYPSKELRPKYTQMVVEHIQQCLEKAKSYGVVLAIQNHHDFIRISDEAIEILKAVNSPWLGLVLDIGSYRGDDPFNDIVKSIPYAVNWQIKEKMFIKGQEQATDLNRLFKIINSSSYRGYLPIETLGAGDPFQKVPVFLNAVKAAMSYV
ncbi:sugar phosphate isomerase/epimerase family protein [Flavitalea sp.]|nr:sugar phosphate isomerase/epimerase family protein [Flavitalea sp.]